METKYAQQIADIIKEKEGWNCTVHDVKKNNNTVFTAISADVFGSNVAPTVYMPKDLEEEMMTPERVHRMADDLIECIKRAPKPAGQKVDVEELFKDKDKVLKSVYKVLVNDKWNQDDDAVSRPVDGDLRFAYKIDVSDIISDSDGSASVRVTKQLLQVSGITEDEIIAAADANTEAKMKPEIKTLVEILTEMMGPGMLPADDGEFDVAKLLVVTSESKCNGAVCITFPSVIKELRERIGDNIMIIPSSIHECIILDPQDQMACMFNAMVRDVNASAVAPQERLSDHVYGIDENGNLVSLPD